MLHEKLDNLKRELILSANLVEGMIDKGMKGLLHKEPALLNGLINEDEIRANDYESAIEELCTNLIAQHEPKAKDLRVVLMVYKINKDLERMADHTVNIAESSLFLIARPPLKPLIDIPRMADMAARMVKDSISAFINEDAILSKNVCLRDNDIDDLLAQLFRELVTYMIADPANIERALNLIRIAHNLERIADLSTNIAEDVVFIVEGKVIKHHKDENAAG